MLIRCMREFRDLKTYGKPLRRVGEEWDVEPSRLAEINGTRYGVMAVEVPSAVPETPPAARNGAKRAETRDAVEQPAERPSVDELEAMTNRELVNLCVKNDVPTEGRPKKAELLSALKAHYGLE